MKIHDISVTLEPGIPIWPGNPDFELVRVNDMAAGASSNVSRLSLGCHTGTHVDAPVHFIPGASGVDTLPLELLTGPATVFALNLPEGNITADSLERARIPFGTPRVLLKTRNSDLWKLGPHEFRADFAGITDDGAQWIVANKIGLIGVDYLSVGPKGAGRATHEILLNAGVVIVEGLNLSAIEPGDYEFYCLPLKLKDSDGAPARAILIEK
ncbi:MAG: cyclase family protein [Chloroflexi bacterium]|nr:cyclase family protein [Chloroflexota bacterium]